MRLEANGIASFSELELIERFTAFLPRSHNQLNRLHESDAELIRLGPEGPILAATTDGLVEEIETGLYRDPELVGWMTATVCASDLAAVGAAPLGMLIDVTLPEDAEDALVTGVARGLGAATTAFRLPVLGGDMNVADGLRTSATALGLIHDGRPLLRRGARPGDRVFVSGLLGLGSAQALSVMQQNDPVSYRPVARLELGQRLRGIATACIDTSDGAIAALDELMRRSRVGFELNQSMEDVLHPAALAAARAAGLPLWTMLAGPHGEYELLFTVPGHRADTVRQMADSRGATAVEIGVVIAQEELRLPIDGNRVVLNARAVRNLYREVGGRVSEYIERLVGMDQACRAMRRPPAAGPFRSFDGK